MIAGLRPGYAMAQCMILLCAFPVFPFVLFRSLFVLPLSSLGGAEGFECWTGLGGVGLDWTGLGGVSCLRMNGCT